MRACGTMPPRPDRAPQPAGDHYADSRKVTDEAKSAFRRIRPDHHRGRDRDGQSEPGVHAERARRLCRGSRGLGGGGTRRNSSRFARAFAYWCRRRAAQQGFIRQRGQLLVDLRQLLVPISVRHQLTASRLSPYRSIFLYRLERGISRARAVSDTFQSSSRSLARRNARSAACLNSSNVLHSSSEPNPACSGSRLPTGRTDVLSSDARAAAARMSKRQSCSAARERCPASRDAWTFDGPGQTRGATPSRRVSTLTKCEMSSGMSSRRSRSGGTWIGTTLSR